MDFNQKFEGRLSEFLQGIRQVGRTIAGIAAGRLSPALRPLLARRNFDLDLQETEDLLAEIGELQELRIWLWRVPVRLDLEPGVVRGVTLILEPTPAAARGFLRRWLLHLYGARLEKALAGLAARFCAFALIRRGQSARSNPSGLSAYERSLPRDALLERGALAAWFPSLDSRAVYAPLWSDRLGLGASEERRLAPRWIDPAARVRARDALLLRPRYRLRRAALIPLRIRSEDLARLLPPPFRLLPRELAPGQRQGELRLYLRIALDGGVLAPDPEAAGRSSYKSQSLAPCSPGTLASEQVQPPGESEDAGRFDLPEFAPGEEPRLLIDLLAPAFVQGDILRARGWTPLRSFVVSLPARPWEGLLGRYGIWNEGLHLCVAPNRPGASPLFAANLLPWRGLRESDRIPAPLRRNSTLLLQDPLDLSCRIALRENAWAANRLYRMELHSIAGVPTIIEAMQAWLGAELALEPLSAARSSYKPEAGASPRAAGLAWFTPWLDVGVPTTRSLALEEAQYREPLARPLRAGTGQWT